MVMHILCAGFVWGLIDRKILAHPLGFTRRPITLRNYIPKNYVFSCTPLTPLVWLCHWFLPSFVFTAQRCAYNGHVAEGGTARSVLFFVNSCRFRNINTFVTVTAKSRWKRLAVKE